MKTITFPLTFCMFLFLASGSSFRAQDNPLLTFESLLGTWQGEGSGFCGGKSKISSSFRMTMEGSYIEVQNHSLFPPKDGEAKGEEHIDHGFISYDKKRKAFVYRQFNSEGFVNQYLLQAAPGNGREWIFVTEAIENFVPGGQARLTVRLPGTNTLETVFEVSTPGKEFSCFGSNRLTKAK